MQLYIIYKIPSFIFGLNTRRFCAQFNTFSKNFFHLGESVRIYSWGIYLKQTRVNWTSDIWCLFTFIPFVKYILKCWGAHCIDAVNTGLIKSRQTWKICSKCKWQQKTSLQAYRQTCSSLMPLKTLFISRALHWLFLLQLKIMHWSRSYFAFQSDRFFSEIAGKSVKPSN